MKPRYVVGEPVAPFFYDTSVIDTTQGSHGIAACDCESVELAQRIADLLNKEVSIHAPGEGSDLACGTNFEFPKED